MAELPVVLNLPDALLMELTVAARESKCSPTVFAVQCIEATLAARRLPNVAPGRCGARLIGDESACVPEELPDIAEPLDPIDIPVADDVEGLEGIY